MTAECTVHRNESVTEQNPAESGDRAPCGPACVRSPGHDLARLGMPSELGGEGGYQNSVSLRAITCHKSRHHQCMTNPLLSPRSTKRHYIATEIMGGKVGETEPDFQSCPIKSTNDLIKPVDFGKIWQDAHALRIALDKRRL